jgi:hypothetical protein
MSTAFEIQIQQFVNRTLEQQNRITKGIVDSVIQSVVMESPIDTGKFVGDWLVGVDDVPTGTTDIYDTQKTGTVVHLQSQVPEQASGHVYTVVNNSEYAWPLENGHSMQAPYGMVEKTVIQFERMIQDEVNKSK